MLPRLLCLLSLCLSPLAADTRADVDALFADSSAPARLHAELSELCQLAPGRHPGTESFRRAEEWVLSKLGSIPGVTLTRIAVPLPVWKRGAPARACIGKDSSQAGFAVLALGGSSGTPAGGIDAPVLEVHSLDELTSLGRAKVEGRIVFFNRPMDPEATRKGLGGYGAAVDQRSAGPRTAARLGAVAALVRSITIAQDDLPHTGFTSFNKDTPAIPAAALGIQSADRLSAALRATPGLSLHLEVNAEFLPPVNQHLIIAEHRGSDPAAGPALLMVGAHLDSWDTTPGALDDGSGVIHAIEAFRKLVSIGTRHGVRCVLFPSEESNRAGAAAYVDHVRQRGDVHLLAMESDAGGLPVLGISLGERTTQEQAARLNSLWGATLARHGIPRIFIDESGNDIEPLSRADGTLTAGLATDGSRYFLVHHSAADTADKVVPGELAHGAATLAACLLLVDRE